MVVHVHGEQEMSDGEEALAELEKVHHWRNEAGMGREYVYVVGTG